MSDAATTPAERTAALRRVARHARRLLPIIATACEQYGPDAQQWLNVAVEVLGVVEKHADGQRIARVHLDLAAELIRGTATIAANAARLLGSSATSHEVELALAAVAYCCDAARATQPHRAEAALQQALKMIDASGRVEVSLDEAQIWPNGVPTWAVQGEHLLCQPYTGWIFHVATS